MFPVRYGRDRGPSSGWFVCVTGTVLHIFSPNRTEWVRRLNARYNVLYLDYIKINERTTTSDLTGCNRIESNVVDGTTARNTGARRICGKREHRYVPNKFHGPAAGCGIAIGYSARRFPSPPIQLTAAASYSDYAGPERTREGLEK